ncbi:MAG: DUF3105 domain-containing protein [Polyangiaceae bacterium]|nr:DUF3105 domain-containing protein [Myxococcales bacterium]MCB9585603.1 DUF3105 domain-containing protein [Polyangiaceae bacterium]MCB9606382.1 DUF3105 domain-containing protein [Polyangiaceae bacterium]
MLTRSLTLVALALLSAACGESTSDTGGTGGTSSDAGSDVVIDAEPPVEAGACNALAQHWPNFGQTHVEICSDVSYPSSPPTSGNHYGSWPQFKTYADPLPYGFMVHGMEHGAVVFSYNCPSGCADEVARAQKLIDEQLPGDVFCAAQGVDRQRVILTPDPGLKSKWAAAAWQWSLNADCFDEETFLNFYEAHYDQAPEHICSDGIDVSPEGGIPEDCGPPR